MSGEGRVSGSADGDGSGSGDDDEAGSGGIHGAMVKV